MRAAAEKDVGSEYDTKKQFQRKDPSKTKWMRASKACQTKRMRVFRVAALGKALTDAPYAPPIRARNSRSDRTVVASIWAPERGTGGGGGGGGGAFLLPKKDMVTHIRPRQGHDGGSVGNRPNYAVEAGALGAGRS